MMNRQAQPAEARASEAEEDAWLRAAGRVELRSVGKVEGAGALEEDRPVQDIPPGGAVPAPHRTE